MCMLKIKFKKQNKKIKFKTKMLNSVEIIKIEEKNSKLHALQVPSIFHFLL